MGLRQNTLQIDFYFALCKLYYSNTPALTFIVENIFHYIGFFFAQNGGCISKKKNKTIIRQRNFHTYKDWTYTKINVQFMTIMAVYSILWKTIFPSSNQNNDKTPVSPRQSHFDWDLEFQAQLQESWWDQDGWTICDVSSNVLIAWPEYFYSLKYQHRIL